MNRIREIRIKKGISQKALALASSVSAPYMHDLENGNRDAKPVTRKRIADAMGCTVEALFPEGGQDGTAS